MFEGESELSYEEEAQIEQPANIYSIIRTLEFTEWAFNFSHISQDVYVEQTNLLLEQYKRSSDAYQDKFVGIDDFCQRYGLTDCKYAIKRIKEGNARVVTDKNILAKISNLTQKFNDISSMLTMNISNENQGVISDFYQYSSDFDSALYECRNLIPLDEPSIKKAIEWNSKIKNRNANDILTLDEEKQMSLDIQKAYDSFNRIINSSQW